jgi:pyruvate/2-oxoglutarate dehydrogenase complex dihydrolipoamide dehydrogenase (E3) component
MVASTRVVYLARRGADYGVHTGPVTVEIVRVPQRKRDIVEMFRNGSQRRVEETRGLDLLMGEARFTGPKTIHVHLKDGEARDLAADTIFINTGTRPGRPPLPGLETVPYIDSTSVMELGEAPEHLLVLGGGYVGLEFGQMFRRFGSRVTIVQRGKQLLARKDADVAKAMADILREDGIDVRLHTEAERVERGADGELRLMVRSAGVDAPSVVTGSHLLVATGRVPNSDRLNLETAGVETDGRGC